MTQEIKYINRDFSSFKQFLIEYTKHYFPNTYTDFSDADPGMMFIEHASAIGDILSFYSDKQIQEVSPLYAQDKENLISFAYAHGYRPKVTSTAIVDMDVYQQIPATISASIASPDYNYCLVVEKGAKIKSATNSDIVFITQDMVDFSYSSSADPTTVSVYEINDSTNQPEYYLLKKSVQAVAGTIKSQNFTFGEPQKFSLINLQDNDIIKIESVVDSDGNTWYEVPNLAHGMVFEDVRNTSLTDPYLSQYKNTAPYLLRLKKVQRRFVSRFNGLDKLQLEFGSGVLSTPDEEIIPNSDNVGMGLIDSISKLDTAYDPKNFLFTKEYGLAPANTVLTINYLTGGGVQSNVPSNDLSQVYEVKINTVSITPGLLNQPLLEHVKRTVIFNNENRASGGGDGDSVEDIRLKTIASFSTQLRNVNIDDHIIRALSMPPKFGTIAKAYVTQDFAGMGGFVDSNPLALSFYVLAYDADKKLTTASRAIKENLKNYLSEYIITNDAINIKDGYYINIGVNFDIIVLPTFNSREVLSNCLNMVKEYFNIDKWKICQPIILSELYNLISQVKGVQSVAKVSIENKYGEENGYSRYGYDILGATRSNVIYTSIDPSIFEIRYPDTDIKGRVITY